MTRRRKLTILILVLLPTAVAIATLSLTGGESKKSTHAAPAQVLKQSASGEPASLSAAMPAALLSEIPGRPESAHTREPAPQNTDFVAGSEDEPLLAALMLADNHTVSTLEFDSSAEPGDSPGHAYSNYASNIGRGYFGLTGGMSGGVGGGSSTGANTDRDVQDPITNVSNDTDHSGSASEPNERDSSNTNEGSSDSNGNSGSDDNEELPNSDENDDLFTPTYPGIGGGIEEEPSPHVSVPEPSTWSLFGVALLGMMLTRRQRAR